MANSLMKEIYKKSYQDMKLLSLRNQKYISKNKFKFTKSNNILDIN